MNVRTYERGRYYAGPNGILRFAGSASGVYLADTVSLVLAASDDRQIPVIGDALMASDDPAGSSSTARRDEIGLYERFILNAAFFRDSDSLKRLLDGYFSQWHPLFPFADGAQVLRLFEGAALHAQLMPDARGRQTAFPALVPEEALVWSVILRGLLAIGSFGMQGDGDDGVSRPDIATNLLGQTSILSSLIVGACQASQIDNVLGVQALLALQLFLFASRQHRSAYHLGGSITRLSLEAGLHRCPGRYDQIFSRPETRELRKRVLYSYYVMDRLLSVEFGLPLALSDTDLDVCLPGGPDKHGAAVAPVDQHPSRSPNDQLNDDASTGAGAVGGGPSPAGGRKRKRTEHDINGTQSPAFPSPIGDGTSADTGGDRPEAQRWTHPTEEFESAPVVDSRLAPAFAMSQLAGIMGKTMDAFNKVRWYRSRDPDEPLKMRLRLDKWWNDVVDVDNEAGTEVSTRYGTLFTCLYHHQIIVLNRHSLSLAPTQLQHAVALQSAVSSARVICGTLSRALVVDAAQGFWPGFVDMTFFAALIFVYCAKRDPNSSAATAGRLKQDLTRAVTILEILVLRWRNASSILEIVKMLLDRTINGPPPPTDSTNVPDPLSFPIEGDVRRLGVTAEGVPDLTASTSGADSFFAFDPFDLGFDQFWMNPPFDGSA